MSDLRDLVNEAWASEEGGVWQFIAAFAVFAMFLIVGFLYLVALTP